MRDPWFCGCHDTLVQVETNNGSWPSNSHNWGSAFAAIAGRETSGPAFHVVGVFDAGPQTRAKFSEVWADVFGVVPQFEDFGVQPATRCLV